MFEPIRGGTRGGQAEFKWSDVSQDKDREHYLGHSINAPTGRWQKNKDIHWYSRDLDQSEAERLEEVRKVKELEAEALGAALGYGPTKPGDTPASSANQIPLAGTAALDKAAKEERRRLKAERKEEKRRRKEARRRHGDEYSLRRHRQRSRSRSPRRTTPPRRPRSLDRARENLDRRR